MWSRNCIKSASRIGIINRSEPAIRFINAVREYNLEKETNLKTVVFYTKGDKSAPFVRNADDNLALENLKNYDNKQANPYLNQELMIEALQTSGCDAIWAGWGFLSENVGFMQKIEQHSLAIIGPTAAAMLLLGDKIKAKELADKLGVATTPWSKGSCSSYTATRDAARTIGYPVILKAAGGGGGKGIRVARSEAELALAFDRVVDESRRIVGDATIFVEKMVERARHLEVQVLADYHGQTVSYGIRDCSLQRYNQKIIEATPPSWLEEQVALRIEASAVRLLAAANYHGAGTVEYLYDLGAAQEYFMEVNTRLQVEHPITEALFGIDIVKRSIDIAMGQKLSSIRNKPRGFAIEARLNAEDPEQNFIPTPGKVALYKPPHNPGIRVDSGIEEGSIILSEYDSMVAKVIATAHSRLECIARLKNALRDLKIRIVGGTTNRDFLISILGHPLVLADDITTKTVEDLIAEQDDTEKRDLNIAICAFAIYQYHKKCNDNLANFSWDISRPSFSYQTLMGIKNSFEVNAFGVKYEFELLPMDEDFIHLKINNSLLPVKCTNSDNPMKLQTLRDLYEVQIVPRNDFVACEVNNVVYRLDLEQQGYITAPSGSIVVSVKVKEDEEVASGDLLAVLEAMKMEITVCAPQGGRIKKIYIQDGEQILAGAPLFELDTKNIDRDAGLYEKARKVEEPIDFSAIAVDPLTASETSLKIKWQVWAREFRSFFKGYYLCANPGKILDNLICLTERDSSLRVKLGELLLDGIATYIKIGAVFVSKILDQKGPTNGFDREGLLMHFFLRKQDQAKGLPEEFIEKLESALACYHFTAPNDPESNTKALYYMYRAHANRQSRKELLRLSLFALQKYYPYEAPEQDSNLTYLLEELFYLSEINDRALLDAIANTKYVLIDEPGRKEVNQKLAKQASLLIDSFLQVDKQAQRGVWIDSLLNTGYDVVPKLVTDFGTYPKHQELILELLAKSLNRDRRLQQEIACEVKGIPFYALGWGQDKVVSYSIVAVMECDEFLPLLRELEAELDQFKGPGSESVFFLKNSSKEHQEKLKHCLSRREFIFAKCVIGFQELSDRIDYFTYNLEDGLLNEDPRLAYIAPTFYRNLRMERMQDFRAQLLYHTDLIYLFRLNSPHVPQDQRLFVLCDIPFVRFEFDGAGKIKKIFGFDELLLEAANTLRAHQARHRQHLYMNRIIVNIGAVITTKLNLSEDYHDHLAHKVIGSGLERIVIYTRHQDQGGNITPIEVILERGYSGYTYRERTPKNTKIRDITEYENKVQKSLRRGSIYPYQIIKMLTKPDSPDFLNGGFLEYDIVVNETGEQEIIPVQGREYGKNRSNIIFGIIVNDSELHEHHFRRIIILGDPSKDFGSLAESECRRVIAAIDLAALNGFPVEWIPVSSGARIDMVSGTENLDWTARVLKRIIEFTQMGGEINVIVADINVGAQSYWNAEATMLMHTSGLLIMTDHAAMLLTGKKALDFSGSVSAQSNTGIGGVQKIMGPNGQAQLYAKDLHAAYRLLFDHYRYTYKDPEIKKDDLVYPTRDPLDRDICSYRYHDTLNQGFSAIGDIFCSKKNPQKKKPFDIRQLLKSIQDQDSGHLERWGMMKDAETAIVVETRIGGIGTALVGVESQTIKRLGVTPNDGPQDWSGATLFPISSKKVARAINAYSGKVPMVILANLSGFDGSPESMRKLQLEFGAEIGRAVVNFKGTIIFVVIARYHGGAYVVFSNTLNPSLKVVALSDTYASVIGGAPAAEVVFTRLIYKMTYQDARIVDAETRRKAGEIDVAAYNELFTKVYNEHKLKVAEQFDSIHTITRAKEVGSVHEIISANRLRPYLCQALRESISGGDDKSIDKTSGFE